MWLHFIDTDDRFPLLTLAQHICIYSLPQAHLGVLCSAAVLLSTCRGWVPGRHMQRNGYVTALRCPGIYLIISVNEVGEAPKPPGLLTGVAPYSAAQLLFLHETSQCVSDK